MLFLPLFSFAGDCVLWSGLSNQMPAHAGSRVAERHCRSPYISERHSHSMGPNLNRRSHQALKAACAA